MPSIPQYQPRFRDLVDAGAKALFERFGPDLRAEVLLISVPTDGEAPVEVGVEPADFEVPAEAFADVPRRAEALLAEDPDAPPLQIVGASEAPQEEQLARQALMRATRHVLEEHDPESPWEYFCAFPVPVERFTVTTVLRVSKQGLAAYCPGFDRACFARPGSGLLSYSSLVDAAIIEFLIACTGALSRPQPGRHFEAMELQPEELVRRAGRRLMATPGLAADASHAQRDLFDICNTISAMHYEKTETRGRMILSRRDHPALVRELKLRKPVSMGEHRAVRKLVEMASTRLCILSDTGTVYALGYPDLARASVGQASRLSHADDLFVVDFMGHQHWELKRGDRLMMRVAHGVPGLPSQPLSRTQFLEAFAREFPDAADRPRLELWELVEVAMNEPSGTLLVFSSGAETEANRLRQHCIRIHPTSATPDLIRHVAAIDGAVLMDPQGTCHAIGVILDGLSSDKGSYARGARYNSAIRYVETSRQQGRPCLAIVISEDGGVDLV